MTLSDRLWQLSIVTVRAASGSLFVIHPALVRGQRGFLLAPLGSMPRGGRLILTRPQLDAWAAGFTEVPPSSIPSRPRNAAAEFFGVS